MRHEFILKFDEERLLWKIGSNWNLDGRSQEADKQNAHWITKRLQNLKDFPYQATELLRNKIILLLLQIQIN